MKIGDFFYTKSFISAVTGLLTVLYWRRNRNGSREEEGEANNGVPRRVEANRVGVVLHTKQETPDEILIKPPRALYIGKNASEKDRYHRNLSKLEAIKTRLKSTKGDKGMQYMIASAVCAKC